MISWLYFQKEYGDIENPFYYLNTTVKFEKNKYETKVLEGYVDTSKLVTKGGRILSGGNLTLDVVELENKNSKISSGGTLRITDKVQKIENTTDVATIKVYDGKETLVFGQKVMASKFYDTVGIGRTFG